MPTASSHFDLAVIGGGPAGSSAAITAARAGARVALLESRQFPRHKVCGEFVSAEALDVLARLLEPASSAAGSHHKLPTPPHLESLLHGAPVMGRTRLWLGHRMLQAAISPPAVSITRHQLDWTLWTAAQAAGVDCRDNCEVSAVKGDSPFELRTAATTITARALIIAAGRWSQFLPDRTLPAGPKWIGLKGHFREPHPSLTTDLYFFRHGYCGVQPVSDDVVNACAMVRSDRASSLPEVFSLHPALRERSEAWQPVIPTVTTAPLFYRSPQPVRGNIAFAGDAAAFIDPFVGDGISIALRSGEAAAQCLRGFHAGQSSLEHSIAAYRYEYSRQFAPLLAVASRVRGLLSLEGFAQRVGFEMLRLPGLLPFIIRRTRQAA